MQTCALHTSTNTILSHIKKTRKDLYIHAYNSYYKASSSSSSSLPENKHHVNRIILTIAVLAAIVIKFIINGWLVIYMVVLLCMFRCSKQHHQYQSSSLLHASLNAGFTADGPWTPCKDNTVWMNTSVVGNIIATIYRTKRKFVLPINNTCHWVQVPKIWAGTLDLTGSCPLLQKHI